MFLLRTTFAIIKGLNLNFTTMDCILHQAIMMRYKEEPEITIKRTIGLNWGIWALVRAGGLGATLMTEGRRGIRVWSVFRTKAIDGSGWREIWDIDASVRRDG
jgi:hypothetical protein